MEHGALVTKIVEEVRSRVTVTFYKKKCTAETRARVRMWKSKIATIHHAQLTVCGMSLEIGAIAQKNAEVEPRQGQDRSNKLQRMEE